MKRKIAAIFAADIAGYSRLVAEDEEETLRRLKAYRKVTDEFIAEAGGRIFNTAGDAVLAEFPSAVHAVRCAIDIQESLRTRNSAFPPSRHMTFRIGITIGDVVESDGDLLGEGVNIAARLEGLAEVGGICVSRAVYEQVANRLSVPFRDMGAQPIRNMDPVHAYMVGKQTGDGEASKSGKASWASLVNLFKHADKQTQTGVARPSWTARLTAACDRQTIQESLIVLLALVALAKVPDAAIHAPAGILTYVVIGLLSAVVVLIALRFLDRRLQLGLADCSRAAAAFGAVYWLGPASIPILGYVGLSSYEAGYIATMELSLFLGCVGACAALRRKLDRMVLAAFVLIALLLVCRYALFHLAVGLLSIIVVPVPIVLVACLLITPQSRVSGALDVALIIIVWLIPFATGLLLTAISSLIPLPRFLQGDSLINFFAMAVPTALAWPAARLARPSLTWSAESDPVIFDRYLKVATIMLAGICVIAFAVKSAERSTPFARCGSEEGVDACTTVIDTLQASAGDRIKALEVRANRYISDSKWDQAIADLSKLIELDPKNPERYTARADLWSQIESYDQAIGDLDAAVALQPNNAKLYLARSDLWTKKGDDSRALADLNQFVRLEPSAQNFAKRAEYSLTKDRFAAAIDDYSTAVKMDPRNVDYLKARANASERKGDAASAQADYLSIIRLYDASVASAPAAQTFYERARIWKQLKNYPKALADYTSAIRLDPNDKYNYDSRYYLVQEMTDNSAQAMKYLDDFVSKEPTFADNYRIRAEARDESDIDKNLSDYDQAIRLRPDDVDFRFARAALLEKKGNFAGAIADYDRAIQIDPKDAKALYRRGMAKSSKGDRTGATDVAAAKALDPDIGK